MLILFSCPEKCNFFEDENLFFQIIGRHFCKATTTYRLLQTKNKNAPGQDPSYLD